MAAPTIRQPKAIPKMSAADSPLEAAMGGSATACYILGYYYAHGKHVKKNAARATYYFRKMESCSSKFCKEKAWADAQEWLRENAVEEGDL